MKERGGGRIGRRSVEGVEGRLWRWSDAVVWEMLR